MKGWLLIAITTLLVHLVVYGEPFSRKVTSFSHLPQILGASKPVSAGREAAIQDRTDNRRELEVVEQVNSFHSMPRSQAAAVLLDEANRELNLIRTTTYSHKTQVDEAIGQFRYDCSGFLKYALTHSVPEALHSLQEATVRRPLAKHFVRFITSLPPGEVEGHWKPLEQVTDLAPGDIIAWLKPADIESDNTGHVMIVWGTIQQHPTRSNEIIVPIIDSTAIPHGQSDSRYQTEATGLGTGNIILVADEAGQAIGYRWSNSHNSRKRITTVALARLE
ncbi:MAG: hypothetical protein KME19_16005 [Microcoleus vaginatus WJT46-NPBG5]|jgi:hypothetical protein|nr:hypothetical protein [Microcoleus vaginatus WJT46-NPBG5]